MDTKKMLEQAEKQLAESLKEREELDTRIKGILQIIEGLRKMGEQPTVDTSRLNPVLHGLESAQGFTDAIRYIIKNSDSPVTAGEIRDQLEAAGYSGQTTKHTLISTYTVLARLKSNREIIEIMKSGKPAYRYDPTRFLLDIMHSGKLSDMADPMEAGRGIEPKKR